MMMQPGSNAAAIPASPTPSQRPMSASSSIESGSPSRAAWVIRGPRAGRVPVDEVAQAVGHRRVGPDQLAGVAVQGVAGGVLLPAPRLPHATGGRGRPACGRLAGHPVGAAVDPVVDHQGAADPGSEGLQRTNRWPRPAPKWHSASAPCWRRCPRRRAAGPARRLARNGVWRQSRCGENITTVRGTSTRARGPDPDRGDVISRAKSCTISTTVSSTSSTSRPSVGSAERHHRRPGRRCRPHLGSADVDSDVSGSMRGRARRGGTMTSDMGDSAYERFRWAPGGRESGQRSPSRNRTVAH